MLLRLRRSDVFVIVVTLIVVQVVVMLVIDKTSSLPVSDVEMTMNGIFDKAFHSSSLDTISSSPASSSSRDRLLPPSGGAASRTINFPERYDDVDALVSVLSGAETLFETVDGSGSVPLVADASKQLQSSRMRFVAESKQKLPLFAVVTVLEDLVDIDPALVVAGSIRRQFSCLRNAPERCAAVALVAWGNATTARAGGHAAIRARLQIAGWAAVVFLSDARLPFDFRLLFAMQHFEKVMYVSPYLMPLSGDWSHLFDAPSLIPVFKPEPRPSLTVACLGAAHVAASSSSWRPSQLVPRLHHASERVAPLLFVAFRMPDAVKLDPAVRCDVDSERSKFVKENAVLEKIAAGGFYSQLAGTVEAHAVLLDHEWIERVVSEFAAVGPHTLLFSTPVAVANWVSALREGEKKEHASSRVASGSAGSRGGLLVAADNVVERVWIEAIEAVAHRLAQRIAAFVTTGSPEPLSVRVGVAKGGGAREARSAFGVRVATTLLTKSGALRVGVGAAEIPISTYQNLQRASNFTLAGLALVLGEVGESCTDACGRHPVATACVPIALTWAALNSCDGALRVANKREECRVCSLDSNADGVNPSLRVADGVCAPYNLRSPVLPSCSASHVGAARICPCIDPKIVPDAHPRHVDEVLSPTAPEIHDPGATPPESDTPGSVDPQRDSGDGDCPCDAGDVAHEPDEKLQRCIEYLSNFSNVADANALVSDLKLGRTVKFRLTYKNPCVRAIAKVPQSLFPLEPYAEFTAFEVDRLLKMNMIPPTTWIFVPLTTIETAAIASLNVQAESGGVLAKQGEGDPDYSKWVAKEVMMYAMQHNLVSMDPAQGRMVLGCSVQLWLNGVSPAHRSPLRFDESYHRLLTASSAQLRASGRLLSEPLAKRILRTPAQLENANMVLRYISETYVFDSIIANDDRASIKNTNVMKTRDGSYTFVHLDQGKSFYTEPLLDKYLLNDDAENVRSAAATNVLHGGICMFRNTTYQILKRVLSPAPQLLDELKAVLPPPIIARIEERHLHWAQVRIGKIVKHMDRCIAAIGVSAALPWP